MNYFLRIGQREVNTVVRQLRKAFPFRQKKWAKGVKGKSKKNGSRKNANEKEEEKDDESDANSEDEFFAKGSKNKRKKIPKPLKLPEVDLDV